MNINILVATEKPFASATLNLIKGEADKESYNLKELKEYKSKQELIDNVKDTDALIIRSDIIDSEVINSAKNLKIIVRAGAGYDNVDLEAAKNKGIVVMNTPGQNANAVTELVLGLMIYMARNTFKPGSGYELKGKRVGILAFGNVGKMVSRICKCMGMDVMAYDLFVKEEVLEQENVKKAFSIEELFSKNDIVSLHIPATPETMKSINYKLFASMPQGGMLINTARKEIIDEDGLIKAMKERSDLKYASDLKPDNDSVFAEFGSRYFSTPKKMGAETLEANANAGVAAVKQIIDFFKTGNEQFRVNK